MTFALFALWAVFLLEILLSSLIVSEDMVGGKWKPNVVQRVAWAISGNRTGFMMIMMGLAIFFAGLAEYWYFESKIVGVLIFLVIIVGWGLIWPKKRI